MGQRRLATFLLALTAAASAIAADAAQPQLSFQTADLNGAKVDIPKDLSANRTLILLGFRHDDSAILDGWLGGLGFSETSPGWLETPVIGVGSGFVQSMIQNGMRKRYKTDAARAHIAPLFGDAAGLAAQAGVDPAQAAVVVVDRSGRVLASAAGAYDLDKARAIRAALTP